MLFYKRSCNKEGGEKGDDVSLEALNHELEEGHDNSKAKGEWRENLHEEVVVMEHVVTAADEDQEEEVASEHIRK